MGESDKEICSMRYMIETERSDLFDVSIVIAMRVHSKGNVNEDG